MVRLTNTRRLNMNAYETTGIRELTVEELDRVAGGFASENDYFEAARLSISLIAIGGAVLAFVDWLFG
jgi:hypothetical protein